MCTRIGGFSSENVYTSFQGIHLWFWKLLYYSSTILCTNLYTRRQGLIFDKDSFFVTFVFLFKDSFVKTFRVLFKD